MAAHRLEPRLAENLIGNAGPRHESLSEREFQVFCKLAAGRSVGEIAAELFLSNKTVSTYRARIMEKMNSKSNADITYYAIKNGIIVNERQRQQPTPARARDGVVAGQIP